MKANMTRERGFTLFELVITAMIVGILAAAVAPMMATGINAYEDTLGNVVALDKLRYATERLAREIREVSYTSPTGFGFTGMTANSMAFSRTSADSSGTVTTFNVAICKSGSTVVLAYAASCTGGPVLTDEVGTLVFSYLDQNGNALALSPLPLTTVRSVQITLTLARANGQTYTQRTLVELKNNS